MLESRDLRLHRTDGRCGITVGSVALFDYDAADTAVRNTAISALREGSAALIGQPRPGRPRI